MVGQAVSHYEIIDKFGRSGIGDVFPTEDTSPECKVVFGGLRVRESAEILRVCKDTVRPYWRPSKVWLLRELSDGEAE